MGLDIRWPIGLMFSLIGVLLVIEGVATGASDKSLGINIDLRWGIVLVIFGALMLAGAIRGGKKPPTA
jgi:hypothetical protein